jgi:Galactosyltransferase
MKKMSRWRLALRLVSAIVAMGWLSTTSRLVQRGDAINFQDATTQDTSIQRKNNGNTTINKNTTFWRDKARINQQGGKVSPPRFLLGIMSHDKKSPREAERRQTIRETYLSFFKEHTTREEEHRICSLHDLLSEVVAIKDCQIAYAFVMGQVRNAPADNRTELLHATSTWDMVRQHPSKDVISLDIFENGKFGKSPTWFRYATLLVKERNLPFDYVIKADSDTLLIPARFLRWMDEQEHRNDNDRTQIYGGTPLDKVGCGWPSHDHCENMTAPYFHAGGFYFASMDLSEYIVSDLCPRSKLFLPHEDVAMGNYVHSMPAVTGKPIVGFKNQDAYQTHWKHPVKDPKRIRSLWRVYMTKKKQRMNQA